MDNIKIVLKSVRQYKKDTVLSICLTILESIFEILIPLTMSNLIDYGVSQGNMNQVIKFGLFLLLEALFQLIVGTFSARKCCKTSTGVATNLRADMYRKIQTYSFSNIDKFSTAGLVTRLTTDVNNICDAYQISMRMMIRNPILLILSVIFVYQIDREMSLIFLIIIPVLAVALIFIGVKAHPYFEESFDTYDKLNNMTQENVRGVRVVKSFVREDYEIEKFKKVSDRIYKLFAKAGLIMAYNTPIMQFCMYGTMLFISYFGAKAIVTSGNNEALGLTTGNLTALISYSMQILMSLMMMSFGLTMEIISLTNIRRVAEVLKEESDIVSPEDPVVEVKDGSIDFHNVSFVYASKASKKVLKDIDLHISSGETIGIIGQTGSSKTSLVQLIPRLYDASEGEVFVGGVNVKDYDLDVLRNSVAMVLQKNELFSGTIKENLRWGNENASDEEIMEACRLSCADEFIQQMPDKYDTYIEQGGTNVSGGQKQRLCIARALLKNPKILILDDSTSAVDTKTDAKIQKGFQEYIPTTTKIIIAQRISSVINADKIIVMNDGAISAMGDHEYLLENCEEYRSLYQLQNKKGGLEND